jgi:opacity protein-like surface antigen
MFQTTHRWLPLLAITLVTWATTVPARAASGDMIVRGGLSYVSTYTNRFGGEGIEEFLDPARPPLGRFDVLFDNLIGLDGNIGVGIGFEYMLTDLIGIDTSFNYSRQTVAASFAGQITFTPYWGQPPIPLPQFNETAPIIGAGTGKANRYLLTVGANFHVLRRQKLNLYAGPVVGLSTVTAKYKSGSFQAAFPSFTSVTSLPSEPDASESDFVLGAGLGVDVPLGAKGWLLSTTARYVPAENLNPWLFQVSLGHRF